MGAGGIIGAFAGLGAGMIGGAQAARAQREALAQSVAASKLFESLSPPTAKALSVELQRFVQTGRMTPALQKVVQQSGTNLSKIQSDPTLRGAQLSALKSFQDVAERGGRTLAMDSDLNKIRSDVAARNRGRVGAIRSSFAERGMGGPGGLELAAQMDNAQAETARESDASLEAATSAQRNALQAIEKSGALAGDLRARDFDQASKVAKAQDDIDRFNTMLLQTTNAANVKTENDAQRYNLDATQRIADLNTTTTNSEKLHNSNAIQRAYDNQAQKVQGQANAMNAVAGQYTAAGKAAGDMWGNIGEGVAKIGASFDRDSDEDEEDDE